MNGPAPGWQPDPTGRHEYRYWDGTNWSDDVSDGGVTSNDPVAGTPEPTQPFDPGPQAPATTPQPTYQAGYDPSGYDSGPGAPGGPGGGPSGPGYGATGYGSSGGGYPSYGTPPAQPSSSGPSTGLLVGLGVLVLVLIGGIVFVLMGNDDDGDDTATDGQETTTTAAGTDPTDPGTTAPPDGGESGGALVDAMAEGILSSSGGVLNEEEAQCMAQAMIDEVGVDRLVELGLEANDGSSDPLDSLTSEEQDAVYGAVLGCMDAGTLSELPGG
jgi:hypothetical protein